MMQSRLSGRRNEEKQVYSNFSGSNSRVWVLLSGTLIGQMGDKTTDLGEKRNINWDTKTIIKVSLQIALVIVSGAFIIPLLMITFLGARLGNLQAYLIGMMIWFFITAIAWRFLPLSREFRSIAGRQGGGNYYTLPFPARIILPLGCVFALVVIIVAYSLLVLSGMLP